MHNYLAVFILLGILLGLEIYIIYGNNRKYIKSNAGVGRNEGGSGTIEVDRACLIIKPSEGQGVQSIVYIPATVSTKEVVVGVDWSYLHFRENPDRSDGSFPRNEGTGGKVTNRRRTDKDRKSTRKIKK